MRLRRLQFTLSAAAIMLAVLMTTSEALGLERWLVPDTSQCAADTTLNPCYTRLQDAVASATAGDTIRILPSSAAYPANVTITQKNITIFGEETARTFLNGQGSPAIIISGVTAPMDIRNITFITSSPGIRVSSGSTQIGIKNNIFEVGTTANAIEVDNTSTAQIMNNTFYQNNTAVSSTQNALSIVNNIFVGNALAISSNVAIDNILNNLFFNNTAVGPVAILFNAPGDPAYKGNVNTQDPAFVNVNASAAINSLDFHLLSTTTTTISEGNTQANANSINGVSPPDMGAYGGALSDTIPFVVSGLTGSGLSDTSIALTWNLNKCYMIEGYNVYYNVNKQGPSYDNLVDAATPASFPYTLNPALSSVPTLTAPTGLRTEPRSETLEVSWNPVANATGYLVSYKTATETTYTDLPLMTSTSAVISGLTNSTLYDISVRAYFQQVVHVAVKAYYAPNTSVIPNPKEALAYSEEAVVSMGTPTYGEAATIQDFPEPLVPYPNLPNSSRGCFVATAAYGYYSAPQVQALRVFRDQYLLTNRLGSAFVRWYYAHGPAAAAWLDAHPAWKPAVRAALLPAVGLSLFMIQTSLVVKIGLLVIAVCISALAFRRKRSARVGGSR